MIWINNLWHKLYINTIVISLFQNCDVTIHILTSKWGHFHANSGKANVLTAVPKIFAPQEFQITDFIKSILFTNLLKYYCQIHPYPHWKQNDFHAATFEISPPDDNCWPFSKAYNIKYEHITSSIPLHQLRVLIFINPGFPLFVNDKFPYLFHSFQCPNNFFLSIFGDCKFSSLPNMIMREKTVFLMIIPFFPNPNHQIPDFLSVKMFYFNFVHFPGIQTQWEAVNQYLLYFSKAVFYVKYNGREHAHYICIHWIQGSDYSWENNSIVSFS